MIRLALFAAANIACIATLVWWNRQRLDRAQARLALASERLRTLAEASGAFAEVATDYEKLLDSIVVSASQRIGDGCLVTLIGPDGESLVNVANSHRDPWVAQDYRDYLAASGSHSLSSQMVAAQVARTGQARLVPVISPEAMVAQTEPKLRALVGRLNVHGFVVVPIRAHARIIGTLSLFRSRAGFPYTDEDATLLQDLADRAGLAIENARLYESLELRVEQRTVALADVNRELEAFSYSVAHDLKAPLRAISGLSSAVLEDFGASFDATVKEHLGLVVQNAERMEQLIAGLLELSRVAQVPLESRAVELSELAGEVASTLAAQAPERNVALQIEDGLETRGDPRLLRALLQNLLGNAWKFTGNRPDARVEVGRDSSLPGTPFFVRDNGAGFNMQHADQLFAPFQRLHAAEDFEGTGIGLATVQRIVRRHGGRVWAKSVENDGATFYFTLRGLTESVAPPRS